MIGGAAGEATCRGCGCTDLRACPGGCWWVDVDYAAGEGHLLAVRPVRPPGGRR